MALLLASMGIYGVTAYTVALRRRELAIRLALGAPRGHVVRMVFRQGTWLVAIGLGVGLALAIGAGQVLSVFFYGLPAAHLPTLLGTVALFLAIGVSASVVPAGRPSATDGCARFSRTEPPTVVESRKARPGSRPPNDPSRRHRMAVGRRRGISEHQPGAELHRPWRARQSPNAHEVRIREAGDRVPHCAWLNTFCDSTRISAR